MKKIIIACKKGERKAERELFNHFAPRVLAICRRYSTCDDDAQEFMQECFILIFDKISRFDENKGAFEGWLYRVCVNRVLELLRKAKKEVRLFYMDQLPEQEVENSEEEITAYPKEKILQAIRELPSGYREVFNLYVFEEWSHKEIGEKMGITASSSRSQLTRARVLLKKYLKAQNITRYERKWA